MNRVSINGQSYALPFERLLPELADDRRTSLRDSITRFWIQVPIVVFVSPTHGRAVIDGMNRTELASEIDSDRKIPLTDMGELSDAVAEELALSLNTDRRQLTPDQLKEARARMDSLIPVLRRAGKSERLIADAVGRSQFFVHSVLQKPTDFEKSVEADEEDDADDYQPERVTSRNGKSYPASAPRRAEPADDEMLDGLEIPSPRDAIFEKLSRIFDEMRAELAALKELDEPMRKRDKQILIRARNDITAALKAAKPAGKRA